MPCPPPGDLFDPGIKPSSFISPTLAGGFFTTSTTWEALELLSLQFSHAVMSDLCDPMDCSTPGFPVHHQLPELLKFMSIESVMPSNHLILCCPLLLLPPIPPSIGVFSNESTLRMRWPKYWSFSFSISPSNEHSGLISFRMDWLDLLCSKGLSRVFSNTTVQKHQFFSAQLSSQSNSHIHSAIYNDLLIFP